MREHKDNSVYIRHICDAIDKISSFASSSTFEEFTSNEWDQSAVIRYFEIIGEAASRIDSEFKSTHADIPWKDMSDFRNFLIHDYMDIDVKIVWDTMNIDIPVLKLQVKTLLEEMEMS